MHLVHVRTFPSLALENKLALHTAKDTQLQVFLHPRSREVTTTSLQRSKHLSVKLKNSMM
jgi:hypothetical protein